MVCLPQIFNVFTSATLPGRCAGEAFRLTQRLCIALACHAQCNYVIHTYNSVQIVFIFFVAIFWALQQARVPTGSWGVECMHMAAPCQMSCIVPHLSMHSSCLLVTHSRAPSLHGLRTALKLRCI
jgi:hypothetical protein